MREREASDAGVPAVRVPVARARALGVDAEDPTALEHVGRRGERPLARAPALTPDRDLPDAAEEPRRLRVVEVLRLGDERDPPADHEREEERVEERPVVRGEDHRTRRGRCSRPSTCTRYTRRSTGVSTTFTAQ